MVPNFDYDGRFLPLSTMGRFFNVKHYCVHDGLRAFFWGGESERIGDCRGEFVVQVDAVVWRVFILGSVPTLPVFLIHGYRLQTII